MSTAISHDGNTYAHPVYMDVCHLKLQETRLYPARFPVLASLDSSYSMRFLVCLLAGGTANRNEPEYLRTESWKSGDHARLGRKARRARRAPVRRDANPRVRKPQSALLDLMLGVDWLPCRSTNARDFVLKSNESKSKPNLENKYYVQYYRANHVLPKHRETGSVWSV